MNKKSAGILLYRFENSNFEVFLVHPGGPFFIKKDLGAWSIPKGEFNEGEDPLETAKREFHEETGSQIEGDFMELSPVTQKGGKTVFAWALKGNINPNEIKSNTFELEWPPKSNKKKSFPEIDKGEWFNVQTAKQKINQNQASLIDELCNKLGLTEKQIKGEIRQSTMESKNSQLDLF